MLFSKALYILSIACAATATAIPQADVGNVNVANSESSNQTDITNDSGDFHILTKCPNQYSAIANQANNLRGVPGLRDHLASIIKRQSNRNSCARIQGRFNNDIKYEYEVLPRGRNCDTQASERPGLTDAVQGFLNWMTDSKVDVGCVRMDNCGTWTGILQIADHRKGIHGGLCRARFN